MWAGRDPTRHKLDAGLVNSDRSYPLLPNPANRTHLPQKFFCRVGCFFGVMSSPTMVAASAAAAAVVASALDAASSRGAAAATEPAADDEAGRRKRPKTPKIDIDALIAQHMANMKNAKKLEAEAKKMVRNEKRKKQRLMKKASSLTPDDLERIAVLKRCGLWDPATGVRLLTPSERDAVGMEVGAATVAAAPATPTAEPTPPSASAAAARESDEEV